MRTCLNGECVRACSWKGRANGDGCPGQATRSLPSPLQPLGQGGHWASCLGLERFLSSMDRGLLCRCVMSVSAKQAEKSSQSASLLFPHRAIVALTIQTQQMLTGLRRRERLQNTEPASKVISKSTIAAQALFDLILVCWSDRRKKENRNRCILR